MKKAEQYCGLCREILLHEVAHVKYVGKEEGMEIHVRTRRCSGCRNTQSEFWKEKDGSIILPRSQE